MFPTRTNAKATGGDLSAAPLRAGFASPVLNNTLIPDSRAAHALLNDFFAISANSRAMSMVNFSCCVCSAPASSAPGVTRRMTASPMAMAVRTEAGIHARL
jgi:hypothetical protein